MKHRPETGRNRCHFLVRVTKEHVKNIYIVCREFESDARNSSVFRCDLKVVMVAELFVTGDREFQTAGAAILNALDWKRVMQIWNRIRLVTVRRRLDHCSVPSQKVACT